jgi:hypothetical protein
MKRYSLFAIIGCALASSVGYADPAGVSATAAPQGQPKIARRFNAGSTSSQGRVPEGTAESTALVQPSLRDSPVARNYPGVETRGYTHSVPAGQAKPPLTTAHGPRSGAAAIGGPANPMKTAPVIIGTVNPAKNTAAVNGTGMKRKP